MPYHLILIRSSPNQVRVKIEGDNEPEPTIPREEGQVPFVFVGTMESITNAKVLLEYHLAHLKVSLNADATFVMLFFQAIVALNCFVCETFLTGGRSSSTRKIGNRSATEKHAWI